MNRKSESGYFFLDDDGNLSPSDQMIKMNEEHQQAMQVANGTITETIGEFTKSAVVIYGEDKNVLGEVACILLKRGFRPIYAQTGEECIFTMNRTPIRHVVILDDVKDSKKLETIDGDILRIVIGLPILGNGEWKTVDTPMEAVTIIEEFNKKGE